MISKCSCKIFVEVQNYLCDPLLRDPGDVLEDLHVKLDVPAVDISL